MVKPTTEGITVLLPDRACRLEARVLRQPVDPNVMLLLLMQCLLSIAGICESGFTLSCACTSRVAAEAVW